MKMLRTSGIEICNVTYFATCLLLYWPKNYKICLNSFILLVFASAEINYTSLFPSVLKKLEELPTLRLSKFTLEKIFSKLVNQIFFLHKLSEYFYLLQSWNNFIKRKNMSIELKKKAALKSIKNPIIKLSFSFFYNLLVYFLISN